MHAHFGLVRIGLIALVTSAGCNSPATSSTPHSVVQAAQDKEREQQRQREKFSWDGFGFGRWIVDHRPNGGNPVTTIVAIEPFSSGVTNGRPAEIVKVKYTESWSFEFIRSCSYFHASYDKEWKTFSDIAYSYDGNSPRTSDCVATNNAPGYEKPFRAAVSGLGYTGKIP